MAILDSDISTTSPKIVMVDKTYLSYLYGFDRRVSLKKDRPYVGLSVRINEKFFVIPLTSQTTQERKKKGLKKQFLVENGFSPTTINKLVHNENVNCEILTRLCYLLNTDIKNIMEYKKPLENV